ncbi:MAG: hypothetical protein GXP11_01020, partial [Gammaproteobacteria bacterium]|nr:hypothetical protein [Gammaproteobacteria bacterium]
MSIEGRLSIALQARCGRVSIDSSRPVYAARVFQGKTVSETLKMLPMLFTVCGTAQNCAGVRACEQALGMKAAAGVECLRESLVAMESVREHLWRILLDWPGFLDERPEKNGMIGLLALQREHRQALMARVDPFQLAATEGVPVLPSSRDFVKEAGFILQQAVFGVSVADWLDLNSPEKLEQWAASTATVAARLLKHVMQMEWHEVGRCEIEALPFMQAEDMHRLLQDEDFIRWPQWRGDCRETTCLGRVDSCLLQHLRSRYGNGLLVRLVARLTELAQLSMALLPETGVADEDRPVRAQNPAIGQVAAARGQLLHRV